MAAAPPAAAAHADATVGRSGGALAGTGTLVRFMLRRDRIRLPAWLLSITLIMFYYAAALPEVFGDNVASFGLFMQGPVGALLGGPGYGSDAVTLERVIVGIYGLYFLLAAGLMNLLLICRHTRAEEQTGRSELVRASVVGRHAPLTAALVVAVLANLLLTLLLAGAMAANFGGEALLFAASVGAVGLVFAGVTAVTVQITEYSRAAAGLAGAVLGASYVIRAAGDMIATDPSGSVLSWLSPVAWSQQTRAYVDGRWWPLLLSLGLTAVLVGIGYALSTRRDLGAGLVAARRGRATAAGWLRSPLAFALRLQRASILWWGFGLLAGAMLYGIITEQIVEAYASTDNPDVINMLGGDAANLLKGYMSVIALVNTLLVAAFVILGLHSVRGEEGRGRAEPVLATAVARHTYLGSYVAVLAGGAIALLLVVGFGFGAAVAWSVGDSSYLWELTLAHLAHVPEVLLFLGLAAVLFGWLPRLLGLSWAVFAYAMFFGFFGPLLNPPHWVYNLSPVEHVGRAPLEPYAWTPALVLVAIAAVLVALGLVGFGRRDLDLK